MGQTGLPEKTSETVIFSDGETDMSIEYDDGWIRTFRAKEIPKFDPKELKMIKAWVKRDEIIKIGIYLTSEKYYNLDNDMAHFILREIMRGNL